MSQKNISKALTRAGIVVTFGVTAFGVAQPAIASATDWDAVAQCESGGNWSTSTGNGYSGGLQFTPQTWQAYGGTGDPSSASRSEQIQVANKVLQAQGPSAWPNCYQGGSTSGTSSSTSDQSQQSSYSQQQDTSDQQSSYSQQQDTQQYSQQQDTSDQQSQYSQQPVQQSSGGDYTVKSGDTLSSIAAKYGTTASHLAAINGLSNPDVLSVGQTLATS